jgi:hypothetical protein
LTNPSSSPNLSGYSGTCDGAGDLLQLGGGQNTIGNTPGGAPYPIGAVVPGKGNGGWTTIAAGDIFVTLAVGEDYFVSVDTVFANTINTGQVSAPYAVTEATVPVNGLSSLHITSGVLCDESDVNCDGSINGLDLGVIVHPSNWQQSPPACDRADMSGPTFLVPDGIANGLDLGAVVHPTNWQQTGNAGCTCTTATPGPGGPCQIP